MERKEKEKAEKVEKERLEKERKAQEKKDKKKKKKKGSASEDLGTLPDGFRVSGLNGDGVTESNHNADVSMTQSVGKFHRISLANSIVI